MLTNLIDFIALASAAALFGGMVFFPAVVAPQVFKTLDEENAGRFLRALFPGYYAFIIVLSAIGAVALYSEPASVAILGAIAFSTVAVRQILVPRINALRDLELAGDENAGKKFAAGHRLSVIVNVAQLIGVLYVLWTLA